MLDLPVLHGRWVFHGTNPELMIHLRLMINSLFPKITTLKGCWDHQEFVIIKVINVIITTWYGHQNLCYHDEMLWSQRDNAITKYQTSPFIMEGDIRKLIFTYSILCFHTMTLAFDYRKQIVGHYWPQNDKITLQKRCLKIYKCVILIYSFSCCNESQNFRKSWFCDIWCCCYFRRWKNSFKVRILFWKTHTK